jgi:cyclic pyranopterin phosphate synthase
MAKRLSHLNQSGDAAMVDVGDKAVTKRIAIARSVVTLPNPCVRALKGGNTAKGNVFQVARLAGIMAAKRTHELIPLCHQLHLTHVDVDLALKGRTVLITATAQCTGKTGVEMEALTAASVSALTVYDMLKGLSHDIVIARTELVHKAGGRRTVWR